MDQLYIIAVAQREFGNFNSFFTQSKNKVAEYLNTSEVKSRAWTFPQLQEITAAEINLITA